MQESRACGNRLHLAGFEPATFGSVDRGEIADAHLIQELFVSLRVLLVRLLVPRGRIRFPSRYSEALQRPSLARFNERDKSALSNAALPRHSSISLSDGPTSRPRRSSCGGLRRRRNDDVAWLDT